MIARAAAAVARSARLRPALLVAAVAGALLLGLAPGGVGPAAARAGLVVAGIGAAAALARRAPARAPSIAPVLAVLARAPLSRDTGVAVVDAGGRRVLVGYGAGGVRVLAPVADEGGAP